MHPLVLMRVVLQATMGVGPRSMRTAAFRLSLGPTHAHTTLTLPHLRSLHSLSKRYQAILQASRTVASSTMSSYTKEPIASSKAHTGQLATIDLSGYDFEQAKLMDERCIVVDENDNPIGALDKKTCRSPR